MFISDLFEAQAKQTLVIIPGGFHPFHPGHLSLYRSAEKAFPGATIVYAATDDRKERPFAFADKQKLAQIAGVNPANFQLVRSPFIAKEITQNFDPDNTVVIFARSEKDRDEQPKAGGVKKDGSPSYLQPYQKGNLAPMSQHGYMAYLPVVQFDAGPSGVTSATQIRNMWPQADAQQKNEIVTDLYPKNPQLAMQILDKYLGTAVAEGSMPYPHGKPEAGDKITWHHSSQYPEIEGTVIGWKDGHLVVQSIDPSPRNTEKTVAKYRVPKNNILSVQKQGVVEGQYPDDYIYLTTKSGDVLGTIYGTIEDAKETAQIYANRHKRTVYAMNPNTKERMCAAEPQKRGMTENSGIAKPGQLVTIIQAPRMLDLLPGETFEVRTSDADGVTLKHGLGMKYDNVKFPHGTYKIAKAQGMTEDATQDPNAIQLKKRAKLAHPFAKSDEEALALYVNDREIKDVDNLEREQNREMRILDRIQDTENKLQQQLDHIDQELNMLMQMRAK